MSAQEFARQLAMGRSWAYEQVACGAVKAVRVGSRVLIPVAELDRVANELLAKAGIPA